MKTDNEAEIKNILGLLIDASNRIDSYEGSLPDRDIIQSHLGIVMLRIRERKRQDRKKKN